MGKRTAPPAEPATGVEFWPRGAQRRRAYIMELVMASGMQCEPAECVQLCRLLDEWVQGKETMSDKKPSGKVLPMRRL